MVAMTTSKFGEIFSHLEMRFRKLSADQQIIYYDRLKYNDEHIFERAIEHLIDTAQHFPTPQQIKVACYDEERKLNKSGDHMVVMRSSCMRCREGYVKYGIKMTRKDGFQYTAYDSRPCAHCNAEPNALPHYTQINDQIFMASRRIEGSVMWVPDLNHREIQADMVPCYTSEALENYHAQESGRTITKPTTDFNKLRSIIPPKQMEYING